MVSYLLLNTIRGGDYIQEIWKEIEEAPAYLVSNFGKVMTTHGNGKKIMKQGTDKDGYKKIALSIGNGRYIHRRVHRLVATAFLENKNEFPIINHIDGDVTNNRVDNLEWCNNSRNQLHRYRVLHKTWDATRLGRQYTFTPIIARNIISKKEIEFDCVNECARYFCVSDSVIFNRLKGRVKNPSSSPKSHINNWYFEIATNRNSNDHPSAEMQ